MDLSWKDLKDIVNRLYRRVNLVIALHTADSFFGTGYIAV